ncbi:hypothetical protein RhiirB3_384903 [Rhizophagus irregularis]|nr:hypothetical protein RhiirB3_384903 [Rhizophagus irregularis]
MDICEAVSSIRNKNKINVRGYLMVKDKKRNNSYYWYCEKWDQLRCNERATTMFTKDQHHLVKFTDYNHAADASRVKVVKSLNLLKERAQQTNGQPVQVIQSVLAGSSQEIVNVSCIKQKKYIYLYYILRRFVFLGSRNGTRIALESGIFASERTLKTI